VETIDISGGTAPGDRLAVTDVVDAAGGALVSAGDGIDDADIPDLLAAGITSVRVRRRANIDMYVSTKECVDRAGAPVLPANETLTEDAVTALVVAGIPGVEARRRSNTDPWIVHGAVTSPDGDAIAEPGTPLDEEIISRAAAAGIGTISVAPATPTEIACAQLCGLGHYQMRATLDVVEPGEYAAWLDEHSAQLKQVEQAQ
jgi:molybdopterin biosynthesis enzyme